MLGGIRGALHALLSTALPGLRVVALVYIGLGSIGVLVLMVAAVLTPHAPIVEQVTQPARQAVTTVSGFISAPPASVVLAQPVAPSAPPLPFVASTRLEVVVDSSPATLNVTIAPVAPARKAPSAGYAPPPRPPVNDGAGEDVEHDDGSSDDLSTDDTPQTAAPVVEEPMVQAPSSLQAATVEQPKPLPTPVPIPVTAAQVKAQVDAANQAAIDAARATATATKARDDAANQAAIDALKAARQKH